MTAILYPLKTCGLLLGVALLTACSAQTAETPNAAGTYPAQARIAPIEVEDMTAQQKSLLGIVDGKPLPNRAKSDLFKTLMHHPDLFAVYDPMGYAVNRSPEISDKHREMVIMRTSWTYQGRYEWSQHYDKAIKAGWSAEDIQRMKAGPDAGNWTGFEHALLKSVDQLIATASIDDETWAELTEVYSAKQVMTLVTLVTHYHWVAMVSKSMGIQPNKPVTAFD